MRKDSSFAPHKPWDAGPAVIASDVSEILFLDAGLNGAAQDMSGIGSPPGRNRLFLPRELLVPPPPPEPALGSDHLDKAVARGNVASWGSGERDRKSQPHSDISLTKRQVMFGRTEQRRTLFS